MRVSQRRSEIDERRFGNRVFKLKLKLFFKLEAVFLVRLRR